MIVDIQSIRNLVQRYHELETSGEIRRYNEAETKTKFIEPLFETLGWNIRGLKKSTDKVTLEEKVSKGRVDYGFWLNEVPRLYLEAKSLKELEIIFGKEYSKQAVNYSWLKSCPWAVLTNFRTIAVYNAESPKENHIFTLNVEDFLSEKKGKYDILSGIEKLELLSKEGFESNKLEAYARSIGKNIERHPVDKQLLEDMVHFREILSKDILKSNLKLSLSQEDLDEVVQRILDRLIFIRNAEDRVMEPNELQSNYRIWSVQEKGNLMRKIREVYQKYDREYNSKIFSTHLCDNVEIGNEALSQVIQGLYSPLGSYSYDFSVITSDVLGSMYEQYLGNILKTTPKRAKLEASKGHRKEQGIYYTPSYIVDYIVKNTVGQYLKNRSPEEIKKVRILDPACGSGSFLIRAYQTLESYWRENSDFAQLTLDSEEFYSRRIEILRNSIFGVDLDSKAVEITQLNLLLRISERKHRLPILQGNIKTGNSLIEDSNVEGKAFHWKDEFTRTMDEGGFEIVIGNPPYDLLLPSERDTKFTLALEYLRKNPLYYPSLGRRTNLFRYFVTRSLTLLKSDGYLGFIIPLALINDESSKELRKFILEHFQIVSLDNFPQKDNPNKRIFYEVKLSTCILIVKNAPPKDAFPVRTYPANTFADNPIEYEISTEEVKQFDPKGYSIPMVSRDEWKILKKLHIDQNFTTFEDAVESYQGEMNITNYKDYFTENSDDLRMLKGVEIGRYRINKYIRQGKKEWFSREGFETIKDKFRRVDHIDQERIVTQQITGVDDSWRLKAVVVKKGTILANSTNYLLIKKYNPRFLCGLLNSRLLDWRFRKTSTNNHVNTYEIDSLPFPKFIDREKVEMITEFVTEMLSINEKLVELENFKTAENARLEERKAVLDKNLNNLVYDIYGITDEERKIIDRNL